MEFIKKRMELSVLPLSRTWLWMVLFLLGNGVFAQEISTPIFHKSHESKKQNAPFSDAVEVGNLFFLAGQIGMDHSTRTLVEGGIEAETKQAIMNIEAVLKQHQLTLDDVVKCTVILADIGEFADFNAIYTKYFTKKPARTTFAASGLARNARIEIEVVAVKALD